MALDVNQFSGLSGVTPEMLANMQRFVDANPEGVAPNQPIVAPPQQFNTPGNQFPTNEPINQPFNQPTNQPTGGGNVPQNFGLGVPSTHFKGQPASFQPRNLATGGAIDLLSNPFTSAQQGLLGQIGGLAGQDVTSQFADQLGGLSSLFAGQNPFGQSGVGQAGLGAFGQLPGIGQDIAGQNPFGQFAGQALGQLGGIGDIAGRFEQNAFGMTPEQQQQQFTSAFNRAATPIEARLRRSGFEGLGGNQILAGQANKISTDLALAESERQAQGLQTAAGLRGGLAESLFGQGQFGAGFQRQGLQNQADILGQTGQSLLGAGQQEAGFGRQQLGDISGNIQAQAGLQGFGQQQQLDQLSQLFGTVRQGELTPLDFLTAIQANQGISRTPGGSSSSNKLGDFVNSVGVGLGSLGFGL